MAYIIQNPKPPKTTCTNSINTNEKLTEYPWFINTCLNRNNAKQILQSCRTIENGNFLVRQSENKNAKYAITLWYNQTCTHLRINQLPNGYYQIDFQSSSTYQMPTFSTIKDLIDFFSEKEMKLIGHCEGFVKLKFNSDILNSTNENHSYE